MVFGANNPSTSEYSTPPVAATIVLPTHVYEVSTDPPQVTVLPPHVYEVSTDPSVYRMAFHQGIWGPNDDNGYYNLHINDDLDEFVGGRAKVANGIMRMACGFVHIPNGWKATKIYMDVRTDDGTKAVAPSAVNMSIYEVTTMTTADPIVAATDGPAALAGLTDGSEDAQVIVNNEFTFTTGLVGNVDNALWINVNFNAISGQHAEYIAGGYITLEKV